MKLVIVGGVAGGASAAARARRNAEDAEIVVFERGPDISFANCGMPYYLGGEIRERDKLLVAKPDQLEGRHNLDLRTRTEVVRIDRDAKEVIARKLDNGREYRESYDKLILAPGAAPIRLPIPGFDLPGVYQLRTLEDMDRIKQSLDSAKKAIVVGSGFIGLEVAENLVHRGVSVLLLELADQVLVPLDREMTAPIVEVLVSRGIELRLGDTISEVRSTTDGLVADLRSGESRQADLIIVGVGVRPESTLARDAGLEIGGRGGIAVDERMRTSDSDIYAVGDVVEVRDVVTGGVGPVPLGGPANRQGRIAADDIFGKPARFRGAQGTAIVRVFDVTAACTGASEKSLKAREIPFEKVYVHPNDHAGYYPGAQAMTIKLLFSPGDGKVLGAQVVGGAGVDKRIDVVSMAIQAGFTVFDLEESELAYAPPYGSAKDPINMAGFVAANIVRGDAPTIHVADLDPGRDAVIDVRTPAEYARGAIPGAVNIPVDDLRDRVGELPRDRRLVVYCQAGQRGYQAVRMLHQRGLAAVNLSGGYKSYRMATA